MEFPHRSKMPTALWQNIFDILLITCKVRRKSALIPRRSGKLLLFQQRSKRMENFRTSMVLAAQESSPSIVGFPLESIISLPITFSISSLFIVFLFVFLFVPMLLPTLPVTFFQRLSPFHRLPYMERSKSGISPFLLENAANPAWML